MKRYLNLSRLSAFSLLLLLSSCLLSSCEELWVENYYVNITGRWYVRNVYLHVGDCPYYTNDRFQFNSNGTFQVIGSNGFYESGYWDVEDNVIYMDFNGDGLSDIEAYINQGTNYRMELDVRDYSYDSRYTLVLVR